VGCGLLLALLGSAASPVAAPAAASTAVPSLEVPAVDAPAVRAPRSSGGVERATAPGPWNPSPSSTTGPAVPSARGEGRWRWPLLPRPVVERGFVAPGSAWGAGHRGLDLVGSAGQPVLAVEGGVVTHVGSVAGRGTVTVLHHDGLRSTYEPVDAVVRLGQAVVVGDVLGRLTALESHCASACLHLGARRGAGYLDPEPLLVRPRIILLPLR
jgi:murein DD-endopeptidase MepM/ murein hydrolase activator NlpD